VKCENAFLKMQVVVLEAEIAAKNMEFEKLEAEVLN